MGLFDRFKKKSVPPEAVGDATPQLQRPPRTIDAVLLRRLDNIGYTNNRVRRGDDPSQLYLAVSLDPEGKVIGDRPARAFHFDLERQTDERWRLNAFVNDAYSGCRFIIDLDVPETEPIAPGTFDPNEAPLLGVTLSRHEADERNGGMARTAFLQSWRIDGGFELPSRDTPLVMEVTTMGVELSRLEHAYVPSATGEDHWALLKCHRDEQSLWLALNLATGEGEVFPRRLDLESYKLALDFLCTFA